MSGSWTLHQRHTACSGCSMEFQAGQDVFSLLRVHEGELARVDLCGSCFDARNQEQDVVYWRTQQKAQEGPMRVDFDLLLGALDSLANDQREDRRDLAYLLALLLVRHRKLRLERVEMRKGKEILVLRRVRSQRRFQVESRELDEERRRSLSATLADLLDPTREADLSMAAEPEEESKS